MSELTNKDKAYIRLKCLNLVIENGSKLDCREPLEKSEVYYNYIVGEKKVVANKPAKKKVKSKPSTKNNGTVKDIEPVSTPFEDSGRKKVLI